MKNILVAGGAGFIGSHLCECLLHQGHQIICLDNFRTGSLKNVSPLMNNPCFKLVEHDITMPYKIQGIDEIYNLACPASPVHYQVSPVETVKTSFIGTLNLLELAHDNQCKLLQASTSEVYGDPEIHPQPSIIGDMSILMVSVLVMMRVNVVQKAFVWTFIGNMAWR